MASGRHLGSDASICEVGGSGLLLPLFGDTEQGWPMALRVPLYLLGLLWCFLGVGIISDVFMSAIETVTAKKKLVKVPGTERVHTVKVWNDTVANLSLMALGSSAPEILLSVIELLGNEFYAGELGPSTIVGSAAFNLLVIIAVCVMCIPDGEVRFVKEVPVFAITASCSMFAYLWLVIILVGITPDKIDVWEGALTFFFFPILVGVAYLADRGYFSKAETKKAKAAAGRRGSVCTRAARRMEAVHLLTGGKKMQLDDCSNADLKVEFNSDFYEAHTDVDSSVTMFVEKKSAKKSENLSPPEFDCDITVQYRTVRHGSAKPGEDYVETTGTCKLSSNSSQEKVKIPLVKSKQPRIGTFAVELFDPHVKNAKGGTHGTIPLVALGSHQQATVELVDHVGAGVLCFLNPTVSLPGPKEDKTLDVVVVRDKGTTGDIKCAYRTERVTSMPGKDYEEVSGELVFKSGQVQSRIPIVIYAKSQYESSDSFRIIIDEIQGGASFNATHDGGVECNIATVTILAREDASTGLWTMCDAICNVEEIKAGNADWCAQFYEALFVGGDPEEQKEAGCMGWFLHILSLPWKLIFALCPPTTYCGGWVCFVLAIAFIGGVTAIIGDMAAIFGCCAGLPDSITAITFVALGTSLPDTFASKTSATQDPYADASIGNVTGSNSVNVFLGLGLPWTMGAIYWSSATDAWKTRYPDLAVTYPDGGFIVQAGDLGFSVTAFLICCLFCIGTLVLRRKTMGGELGGPKGAKYCSAVFFVLLWFYYVGVSSWKVIAGDVDGGLQVLALSLGIVAVFVLCGIIVGLMSVMGVFSSTSRNTTPAAPPRQNSNWTPVTMSGGNSRYGRSTDTE